jgi:pimeloyl-ACP methyl ester carboxylesterase
VSRIAELPNDLKLPYVEHGDASGLPAVFLHGFADSWRSFERLLPHIPETIHAVALTQRGHGDASRPAAGYAVRDFAGDLALFMDVLHLESAVLAGHSMGSAVAQRFAIDHPDRTLGLVLIGASATTRGTPEARRYWDAKLASLTDPVDREFVRTAIEEAVVKPVPPAFLDALLEESVKVPAFVWKEAIKERWRTEDNPEELRRIRAPTLICWGDRDPRYSRSDQDALTEAIRDSRLLVYPGAGHALHWEEPERFASDLVAFVRGLSARKL